MKIRSLTEILNIPNIQRAFTKSLPFCLVASLGLFFGYLCADYLKASRIADLNNNGITTIDEWNQSYKRIDLEPQYPDNPFLNIHENHRLIRYHNTQFQ